jgi:hypothetical protein
LVIDPELLVMLSFPAPFFCEAPAASCIYDKAGRPSCATPKGCVRKKNLPPPARAGAVANVGLDQMTPASALAIPSSRAILGV